MGVIAFLIGRSRKNRHLLADKTGPISMSELRRREEETPNTVDRNRCAVNLGYLPIATPLTVSPSPPTPHDKAAVIEVAVHKEDTPSRPYNLRSAPKVVKKLDL